MGEALPPGWRELAGGFASGDVLLVLTSDGLHRVKAREFGAGFAIEKTPLDVVKALLETHGLHIVTAADKAVLEACDAMPMQSLLETELDSEITPDWYLALARAELIRREKAKP